MPQMYAGFVVVVGKKEKEAGGGGRKRQVLSFGNLRQNFHVGLPS